MLQAFASVAIIRLESPRRDQNIPSIASALGDRSLMPSCLQHNS